MVEFNLVLENSRLKEDLGIEHLHFSKCTFNIANIEYFRELVISQDQIIIKKCDGSGACLRGLLRNS